MVANQRQLFIVVSDWGSYLNSHFPTVFWGILFLCSCLWAPHRHHISYVLYCFVRFTSINMCNPYHPVLWSECSYDDRDRNTLNDMDIKWGCVDVGAKYELCSHWSCVEVNKGGPGPVFSKHLRVGGPVPPSHVILFSIILKGCRDFTFINLIN
jgi:hypothetical protein